MTDRPNRWNSRPPRRGTHRRLAMLLIAAGGACALAAPALAQDAPPLTNAQAQPEDLVTFSATSEPVELMEIVNFIVDELGINVSVKGTVTGQVMFNANQEVPRSELLPLMEALLAQYNYSLILDPVGIYLIQPASEVTRGFEGQFATTRIISTPNVKPSSLKTVLDPTAAAGGQAGSRNIAYIDDLGIIVVTDTPRNVRAIEELVRRIIDEYRRTTFTRIDLNYVAAGAARERAVALVGQGGTLRPGIPGQEQNVQIPGQASSIDNLADRLTIDPTGNALMFRGTKEEVQQVRAVLELIDLPTTLKPVEYTAGAGAAMIANIAAQRGLGEVIQLEDVLGDNQQQNFPFQFGRGGNQFQNQSQQQSTLGGGSVMMVDQTRGKILYYGTEQQQEQLAALIDSLEIELDEIVIERYPVRNVNAQELADLLQAIIEQDSGADSPLLPGSRGAQTNQPGGAIQQLLRAQREAAGEQGPEGSFVATAQDSFVTAHEATNVVIVKAPLKLQQQFARIITELDVRRPQVYVEAKIVAVSDSRDFRLAVEGQLQAGQFYTQTAYGLGTRPDAADAFTDPKLPLPGLAGFTASLIKSEYVPFIINAIQSDTDARILSSPKLLVNDNEEAEIVSLEEQPFTTTQVGETTDITSFGGYETAGTSLLVTPSISEAGYLRLAYEIELSNFTASGSGGIPPPKNTRNVRSDSVTIPTDTTIVVGGITVTDTRNTVVKVPLLGDIPLVGHLFRDTAKEDTEQLLYIFITPRILNDRNFADLRLLTRGPQDTMGIGPDLPELQPSRIQLVRNPLLDADPSDGLSELPGIGQPATIPLENEPGVVRRTEER